MDEHEIGRWSEFLERLAPSNDYFPAVEYFSHFNGKTPHLLERHLDGFGGGFDYHSCRFPDAYKGGDDNSAFKGVLLIRDLTFGDPEDEDYSEILMPFSEFLRWMRAIGRFWSEVHPADEAKLQNLFHERDLAYFESEVGPRFDNGATWWRKIEEQRRTAIEVCRSSVASSHWRFAGDYFRLLPDSQFASWLRDFVEGRELPNISHIQIQRLPDGGLKFFTPSWGKLPEQFVEIMWDNLGIILSQLMAAFIERRPSHADTVRLLAARIKIRS